MKIPNGCTNYGVNHTRTTGADQVRETPTGRHPAAAHSTGSGDEDQSNLSNLAVAVHEMLEGSPQRMARLDELAARYEAGQYEPNSRSIASHLIEDAISSAVPRDASGTGISRQADSE